MRDITRRIKYLRHHDGDVYVRLRDLLSLLDEVAVTEPVAGQVARELRRVPSTLTDAPARWWWRR
jgi:hypothetical protein